MTSRRVRAPARVDGEFLGTERLSLDVAGATELVSAGVAEAWRSARCCCAAGGLREVRLIEPLVSGADVVGHF